MQGNSHLWRNRGCVMVAKWPSRVVNNLDKIAQVIQVSVRNGKGHGTVIEDNVTNDDGAWRQEAWKQRMLPKVEELCTPRTSQCNMSIPATRQERGDD